MVIQKTKLEPISTKMKMRVLSLLITLSVSPLAIGGSIARDTPDYSKIETVKATAAKEKKHIAYIYTNSNSDCPLCQSATTEFVRAVRAKSVLVYLDTTNTKSFWANLPDSVRTPLSKSKIIPMLVVTEADGSTVVASLTYSEYKADTRGTIKDLKAKLKD